MAEGMNDRQDSERTRVFFDEIHQSDALPESVDAGDAAVAVMCVLSQRITRGEAKDWIDSLGSELKGLLQSCTLHRHDRPEIFGRETFLRQVADHMDTDAETAENVSRTVFAAMRSHFPSDELDQVEAQLPEDLVALWRSGA